MARPSVGGTRPQGSQGSSGSAQASTVAGQGGRLQELLGLLGLSDLGGQAGNIKQGARTLAGKGRALAAANPGVARGGAAGLITAATGGSGQDALIAAGLAGFGKALPGPLKILGNPLVASTAVGLGRPIIEAGLDLTGRTVRGATGQAQQAAAQTAAEVQANQNPGVGYTPGVAVDTRRYLRDQREDARIRAEDEFQIVQRGRAADHVRAMQTMQKSGRLAGALNQQMYTAQYGLTAMQEGAATRRALMNAPNPILASVFGGGGGGGGGASVQGPSTVALGPAVNLSIGGGR